MQSLVVLVVSAAAGAAAYWSVTLVLSPLWGFAAAAVAGAVAGEAVDRR